MGYWNNMIQEIMADNILRNYLWSFLNFTVLVLVFVLAKQLLVRYLGRIAKTTTNDFDDFLVVLFSKVHLFVLIAIALYWAILPMGFSLNIQSGIRHFVVAVVTVNVVILVEMIIAYSLDKIYRRRLKQDEQSIKLIVNSMTSVLKWVIWIFALIFILDNLGINITAMVAGIGIGGIAVAIAAQAILGDAFSAFSIFLDKPFAIGDFIIIDNFMGTVEHIGIKTTRVRSLDGEILVFSNSDLTKSRIHNYRYLESKRIVFTFRIIYETPLEKVKKVPALIKDIISAIKDVRLDRVHLQSLGESALVYEVVYYILSPDYNLYMDRQQEVYFSLMERFEKEGISLAYPTQTLYLKGKNARII